MKVAARIHLSDVFAMLEDCAPGHTRRERQHHHWVTFQGATYQGLPIGERGANRPTVYAGKVRAMVRLFGIGECANRHLPGIWNPSDN